MLKKCTRLLVLLLITILMSGCGNKIKDEAELKQELLNSKDFWIADGCEVTDFKVMKRLTEEENRKDTVYVSMKVGNEFYYETMAYTMYYTEYNDGWILDNVEPYYGSDFEYIAVPLKKPTQEGIFDEIKSNSNISIRSFFEDYPILSVSDLYFFEDGKYTYEVEDEAVDLEKGIYGCKLIIDRVFELVTVHEVMDIEFWFESGNPDFFGWNLASAEISEITYDWNIEGIWKHPNNEYPIVVSECADASTPTIEVQFTCRDFFGNVQSTVESFELGAVNTEQIERTSCTPQNSWGIWDVERFVITPDAALDLQGEPLWIKEE